MVGNVYLISRCFSVYKEIRNDYKTFVLSFVKKIESYIPKSIAIEFLLSYYATDIPSC